MPWCEEYTEDEHEDLIIPIGGISAADVKVEGPSATWIGSLVGKGPEGSKNGMPNSHHDGNHAGNPRESFRIFEVPSGNLLQFAIENGPVEIVDLPIEHGGSFHSFSYVYLYVYQRLLQTFNGGMLENDLPSGELT